MIGEQIKKRREQLGWSQDYLASQMGYKSRSSINKIELGISDVPQQKVVKFSKILNVSIGYLMEDSNIDEEPPSSVYGATNIPLYDPVCCGNGVYTDDCITDYINLPQPMFRYGKNYFAQYAVGDSMAGAGIDDGDLLIFERSNVITDGKIGCFVIDGQNTAVCKRYKKTSNGVVVLMPANDSYDPIIIDSNLSNCRCLGVLTYYIKKAK